jgi:hypothetical protein
MRILSTYLVLVALVISAGCTARSPVAKVQIAALTVGESVLAIDEAERTVRAANLPVYVKADQDKVGAAILKALYASRAFERAAVAAPASGTSEAIETAKLGLDAALKDLSAAVPAIQQVRVPIMAAISAAQAALASWRNQ